MKYIGISLGALAVGAIVLMSAKPSQPAAAEGPAAAVEAGFSSIVNPYVPQQMQLCGKTVKFDRADMWERMDRELASMSYTHGNTLLTIKRANKYFPVLEPILKKNGVPTDLLYLACIESYLNERAYSPAKAAGIWQFIPSTAKEYGLEVSDEVDERYNLEKATAAACRYLKNAYNRYGNWESVMASYNGGMARITKELAAQQVDTSFDLYLADETMRYVYRVMAMKLIMEDPSAFGFSLNADQLYQPVDYTETQVSGPVADWPSWAKEQGITYAQLREANPWIRAKSLTNKAGKTYTVKIPVMKTYKRPGSGAKPYNPAWVR